LKSLCGGITIRANDPWKFWWDLLILLFAIFNSVTLPLVLSFEDLREFFEDNRAY